MVEAVKAAEAPSIANMTPSGTASAIPKMEEHNNGEIFGVRRAMKRWFGTTATTGTTGTKPRTASRPPTGTDARATMSTPTPPVLQLAGSETKTYPSSTDASARAEPTEKKSEQSYHTAPETATEATQQSQTRQAQSTPTSEESTTSQSTPNTTRPTPLALTTQPKSQSPSTSSKPPSPLPSPGFPNSSSPLPSPRLIPTPPSRASSRQSMSTHPKRSTTPTPADYYLSRKSSRNLDGDAGVVEEEDRDQVPESIKPSTLLPKSTITTTITATAPRKERGLMYRLSVRKRWSGCGPGAGSGGRRGRGRVA